MRRIIAIPARMASSRLPNKLLLPFNGKPILRHVIENAAAAKSDLVVVCSSDDVLLEQAKGLSAHCFPVKTPECNNGTERVFNAMSQVGLRSGDKVVNLQGDAPLLRPELIESLFDIINDVTIATLATWTPANDIASKVKVVLDENSNALYFSRSAIPYGAEEVLEHIGIYGFSEAFIKNYAELKDVTYGREDLEQLKWMYNGYKIRVRTVNYAGISIDTEKDYKDLIARHSVRPC